MPEKSVCEEQHFRSVFDSQSKGLRNFMYYKCGDLDRAEDLMQEAFVRLFENCKKVVFEKAKSFLFTVANRLFLNEVSHKKVVLQFEKNQSGSSASESPQFVMEEAEFKKQLEDAISSLTEGQREVFLMNRIDKLSYQEIADRLDLSVKAVEKRMHLALKQLKDKLDVLKTHKI